MIINKDLCKKCGVCVSECPHIAISKNDDGDYVIDLELCDDCDRAYGNECVRACKFNAISFNDGTFPEPDPMWRVRPEHVLWMMPLIAAKGYTDESRYTVGHPQWDMKRKLIADAYLNPDLEVRLTEIWDDICFKCVSKQIPGHMDVTKEVDDKCYEALGLKPGMIVKLWDIVRLIEENFTEDFVNSLNPMPDEIYNDLLSFLSPGAKMLENE